MMVIGPQLNLTEKEAWIANIVSVVSTIFMRFIIGPMCDTYGARRLQAGLLIFGGVMVIVAAVAVRDATSLIVMRFLIGAVGGALVPCQYWNSEMFVKELAGTAQAISAGWGNLGGGVTQMVMPLLYTLCLNGMSSKNAWRYALLFPGGACLLCGVCVPRFADDTPRGNITALVEDDTIQKPSTTTSAREGFSQPVAWMLAFQYGCCFGVELTVNNMLATHFTEEFELDMVTAGTIASLFGATNLFARACGGCISDRMNKTYGFRGRLGCQAGFLLFEGIMLFIFSRISDSIATSIVLLVMFSLGVHGSEGTTYAIVPYVKPSATGSVSGVVGAGGSIGAVLWGLIFLFRGSMAPLDCLTIVSLIVIASSLSTFFILVQDQPGLLFSPTSSKRHRGDIS
mmetsp:Transcript_107578/g.312855  ORF Transcript_107578/g.312855 Transcript_107578/m.312855 type:complete len:399 (-) Transcript_107578:256-1452(-)